jgi:hypothetical protein
MTPTTPLNNSSQQMLVREVLTTGLTAWVDYIPIQAVTEVALQANRHADNGHVQVVFV